MSTLDYTAGVAPPTGCLCATLTAHAGLTMPELSQQVSDRTLDIANRLRFVCAHLPSDELIELATRMAMIEIKYACGFDPAAERRNV